MRTKEEKNAQAKLYYLKNKEKIKLKYDKEKKAEYNKLYHSKNNKFLNAKCKAYYIENADKAKLNALNYYALNKKHYQEKNKEYRENNKERIKKRQQAWTIANKEALKNKRYLKAYGITLNQYNEMLNLQNGKCEICGIHYSELSKNQVLGVDHNHKNGIVRGLLCKNCNNILGFANDSIETFIQCTKYLSKYR
jgi:hypothetical protein